MERHFSVPHPKFALGCADIALIMRPFSHYPHMVARLRSPLSAQSFDCDMMGQCQVPRGVGTLCNMGMKEIRVGEQVAV